MIHRENIKDIYPLTPMQQGMLYHAAADERQDVYHEQISLIVEGELRLELFQKSLTQVVVRHDVLRTVFSYKKTGKPVQMVLKKRSVPIVFEDISGLKPQEQERLVHNYETNDLERRFDLERDVLLRMALFKLAPQRHYLVLSFHHIIMDGWCMGIFFSELFDVYRAIFKGERPTLTPAPPFKLYVKWLLKQDTNVSIEYWKTLLGGYDESTSLPRTVGSPCDDKIDRREIETIFPLELTGKIRTFSQTYGITIGTVIQTVWGVLLQRFCGVRDAVFGAVVSGRPPEVDGIESMVGLFINTLPLRIQSSPDKRVVHLLREVGEQLADSRRHQCVPLGEIQAISPLKGNLLDHVVVVENYPLHEFLEKTITGCDGCLNAGIAGLRQTTNYNLNVVADLREVITLKLNFNGNFFAKDYAEGILARLEWLSRQIVECPQAVVEELEILLPEEKQRLLSYCNGDKREDLAGLTLHGLVEAQVLRSPRQTAVFMAVNVRRLLIQASLNVPGPRELRRLGRLKVARNEYVYRFNNVTLCSRLELGGQQIPQDLTIIRTHRQDFLGISPDLMELAAQMDGGLNLEDLYHSYDFNRCRLAVVVLDEASADRPIPIEMRVLTAPFQFGDFVSFVAFLCNVHLLTAADRRRANAGSWCESASRAPEQTIKLGDKPCLGTANLLLLGDTVGMAGIGILYLASYLKRHGIDAVCRLNDYGRTKEMMATQIKDLLKSVKPSFVGVSLKWFPHIARVLELCRLIKEYDSSVKIVLGGNSSTSFAGELIRQDCVDFVALGDGELPLLQICRGDRNISNCIYKIDNSIVENPVSYVQDGSAADEVYLSHMPDILTSVSHLVSAPYFFIYTGKGCAMNCFYCAGCRDAQKNLFNRSRPFVRDVNSVRRDIQAVLPFTSTLLFDFEQPGLGGNDYFRRIWEGLDLSGHFCVFYAWYLPDRELLDLLTDTFKYVQVNIDLCSLSQRHRMELSALKVVKPQPSDHELLAFLDCCEEYFNLEVGINVVLGLPRFTTKDIEESEHILAFIRNRYSCFRGLDWGRLHAQPGASLINEADHYDMVSSAISFNEFLEASRANVDEEEYPGLENLHYPYIYYKDESMNIALTRHYSDTQQLLRDNPRKHPDIALSRSIDYLRLDRGALALASRLAQMGVGPGHIVAVMMERSVEMIVAIFGVLKSGAAYMPLDPNLPPARKRHMIQECACRVIVSQSHLDVPDDFSGNIILVDETMEDNHSEGENLPCYDDPDALAYVIFTSGTTGKPKGVMVPHRGIANTISHRCERYRLHSAHNILQLFSYSFDGFLTSLFTPLASGAPTYLMEELDAANPLAIRDYIQAFGITHFIAIPSLYQRILECSDRGELRSLECVTLAGEAVTGNLLDKNRLINEHVVVVDEYGLTETSVASTVSMPLDADQPVNVGIPIPNTGVSILAPNGQLSPEWIPGELWIHGEGLAWGYINDVEQTYQRFSHLSSGRRSYKTGDLGRWLPAGVIQLLGRSDYQVKIRGYRIELGGVEAQLAGHPSIHDTVVLAVESKDGDTYLAAYYTCDDPVSSHDLRSYLRGHVPDYMIPSRFMQLETIPHLPGGKVDRRALPEIDMAAGPVFTPPRDHVELKLAEIWSEVLSVDRQKIGIDVSFFDLGGHSLKATMLVSRINREFHQEFSVAKLFEAGTVRELAIDIKRMQKKDFLHVEPAPAMHYYPQSSAQKRLFFLGQFENIGTSYNAPLVLMLSGSLDPQRLDAALLKLLERHEPLRTSFHWHNDQPVQRIHDAVDFAMARRQMITGGIEELLKDVVRPFDLSKAPLFRACLASGPQNEFVLVLDIHHIIADGTSIGILINDLICFYNGDALPQARIQYKDFAVWQSRLLEDGKLDAQQDYWLDVFSGDLPVLQLPGDFPRPAVFSFEGEIYNNVLGAEDALLLRRNAAGNGATIFMSFLAALYVLLYKYAQQEDIIVGCSVSGRSHDDLKSLVGMFVNEMAIRGYPRGRVAIGDFLAEVREASVRGFENQDMQFEDLVERLKLERDPSRNPLFDVCLSVQNFSMATESMDGIEMKRYQWGQKKAKFDLTLFVVEEDDCIQLSWEYCASLFKYSTIQRMANHYLRIIHAFNRQSDATIASIDLLSQREKAELLGDLQSGSAVFPQEKTVHGLFEEQVERAPEQVALVAGNECLTYSLLNEHADVLAHYLVHRQGITPDTLVAVLMDKSLQAIAAILGILKGGGAYVPIDPSYPEERIKKMIDFGGIRLMISEKKFIRGLNRLLWECPSLQGFLSVDSDNVSLEEELEKSALMDRKLWEYVGREAVDDITGGGWTSSYTGDPIPAAEMEEYSDNIFEKLAPVVTPSTRILEIGCASGLSMYRLAPLVGLYWGTDISSVIIEKNRQRIQREGIDNIRLSVLAAHEIDKLAGQSFDIIIMNSVIQHFHGHNYLASVIGKAVDCLGDNGLIFIGDVMDQDKKRMLIKDMLDERKRTGNPRTKIDWDAELFVSPSFFEDLQVSSPQIRSVDISGKIASIENELTRFRYDAILTVDKDSSLPPVRTVPHKVRHDRRHLADSCDSTSSVDVHSGHLAYVIYTSGTTGHPKGAMVEHRNLVGLIAHRPATFDFSPADVWTMFHSYCFDFSVWELFGALLTGGRLVIVPPVVARDIPRFLDILSTRQVSVLNQTPSAFYALAQEEAARSRGWRRARLIIFGGEALSPARLQVWQNRYPHTRLVNMYGITETTVHVTYKEILPKDIDCDSQSIGMPLPILRGYGFDRDFNLAPSGVSSEFCISGAGVCRGYLNDPEETNRCFVPNPLNSAERLYRSGDLVARTSSGEWDYRGRIDRQIKVRGFRIEPSEVCARVVEHPQIEDAVVTARQDGNGENMLAVYYVAPQELDVQHLREHMSAVLPDYMVPSVIARIPAIPLTVNNKVDFQALLDDDVQLPIVESAPQNAVQRQLALIWAEILGIQPAAVGIDHDFFECGGHSLKATALLSRIHKEFSVKVPLAEFFGGPTILSLSSYLERQAQASFDSIPHAEKREYYPLSSAQQRLFVVQQLEPENLNYNVTSVLLIEGELDHQKVAVTFNRLVERHENLRTFFVLVDDEPVQKVAIRATLELATVQLEHGTQEDLQKQEEQLIREFVRPFDLSKPPLFRVTLVCRKRGEHLMLVDMHHIICDGVSVEIIKREFAALYESQCVSSLSHQYKDYSHWHNCLLENGGICHQEDYWLREFANPIPILRMPAAINRGEGLPEDLSACSIHRVLGQSLVSDIRKFIRDADVTLYIFLLAAYNALLYKYTGQQDIVVGSVIAGRRHQDLQRIVGMFVNMLPLRNRLHPQEPFRIFLDGVKQRALDAFENQDYPFDRLVEHLDVKRQYGRFPLLVTGLSLQNIDVTEVTIQGLRLKPYQYHLRRKSEFDFHVVASEDADTINLTFEYLSAVFHSNTANCVLDNFIAVMTQVVQYPGISLQDLDLPEMVGLEPEAFSQEEFTGFNF